MNYLVKKYALLIAIIMMNAQAMFAQSSLTRISGNVKDENGEVLPYTTVRLKDTSTGCITDYNGNFSFNAKADGQTLVVSCIGYKDYEVKLSSRTSYPLKIVLRSSAYDMEEVVIKPTRERYQKMGNPAVELITEIINRRNTDNPFNNEFVSRDRYETFLIALDNFTEEKQQQATFRNFPFLKEYVDTSQVSGKPILNVSSRELAATDYFQMRPSRQKQKRH